MEDVFYRRLASSDAPITSLAHVQPRRRSSSSGEAIEVLSAPLIPENSRLDKNCDEPYETDTSNDYN